MDKTYTLKKHIQRVGPNNKEFWWDPKLKTKDLYHWWDQGSETWDTKDEI